MLFRAGVFLFLQKMPGLPKPGCRTSQEALWKPSTDQRRLKDDFGLAMLRSQTLQHISFGKT